MTLISVGVRDVTAFMEQFTTDNYEWVQQTRGSQCIRQYNLAKGKHSNLLGPFVSYKENEVLLIRHLGLHHRNITDF